MEFRSFEQFWPYYLGEHRHASNRLLHYVGTTVALIVLARGVATLNPLLLAVVPLVGYAPPWIGHFLVEKNRPATFRYPLWSLRGDFRMLRLALAGRMRGELARLADAG